MFRSGGEAMTYITVNGIVYCVYGPPPVEHLTMSEGEFADWLTENHLEVYL